MDNESNSTRGESTRGMLGKLPGRRAPAGFTGKVMDEVQGMERRRIYRRLVLALVLRSVVFVVVLLGLLWLLFSPVSGGNWGGLGGGWGGAIERMVAGLEQAGKWVWGNVYLLVLLVVLLFARKMLAIK